MLVRMCAPGSIEYDGVTYHKDSPPFEMDASVFDKYTALAYVVVRRVHVEAEPKSAAPNVPEGSTDLGVLDSITGEQALLLREHGFDTIQQLACATTHALVKVPTIGRKTAANIKQDAHAFLTL